MLAEANGDDRNAIAWLSVLKHSSFTFDFTTEILREKLAAHDFTLRHSDYETFVDLKSVSHPALALLSTSSKIKVRQILLLMLTEAGLLGAGKAVQTIQRPVLSPTVLHEITSDNPRWLAGFLVPDIEIGGM